MPTGKATGCGTRRRTSHEGTRTAYPLANLSTAYGVDVARASAFVKPAQRLTFNLGTRLTRFGFDRTDDVQRARSFTGVGGDAGLDWQWAPRWRMTARYSASGNESELALSELDPGVPADRAGLTVRRNSVYQDYDSRVTFSTGSGAAVAAGFVRGLALDPLPIGTPTLDTLRMAGVQADVRRDMGRVDVGAGAEGAIGRSSSNRGDEQPYREVSGRARIATRLGRFSTSASGGLRHTTGSYFYPVGGQAWNGGIDLLLDASRYAQFRASATRSFLSRDVRFQYGDDRTDAYVATVVGPSYQLSADYADTRSSSSGLFEAGLLVDARPEELLATRPGLFGFLYASRQLRRGAEAKITPFRGLTVFGRGRLDRLELPTSQGTSLLDQQAVQAGAILGVRQMQVEIGWAVPRLLVEPVQHDQPPFLRARAAGHRGPLVTGRTWALCTPPFEPGPDASAAARGGSPLQFWSPASPCAWLPPVACPGPSPTPSHGRGPRRRTRRASVSSVRSANRATSAPGQAPSPGSGASSLAEAGSLDSRVRAPLPPTRPVVSSSVTSSSRWCTCSTWRARRYSYLQSAPFASPVGLATGPDDTIYVADSGRRAIFVYGADGRLRRTLGRVHDEPMFIRPSGVAVGPDGLLYVVDSAAAAITALSPDGRVVRTFGRRGAGPAEFNYPTHLAFGPDGLLYVVDALNARLQVLQRDGTFVRAFGRRGNGTGDFDKPKGIAFDPDGHVYVADGLHDVFQIFDTAGRLLLVVGESGAGPGQFAFPSNLHVDRNGRVYVADALNGRVEVFQYLRRTDAD